MSWKVWLPTLVALLAVVADLADAAPRRRKRTETVRAYRTSDAFWETLEAEHAEAGAVYLKNHNTMALRWNSAARNFDSELERYVAVAILDAEKAEPLRTWSLTEVLGAQYEDLTVIVTDAVDKTARELSSDEVYREQVVPGLHRWRFAIPNFEDRVIIEISYELYAGRGGLPYYEADLDLPFPCLEGRFEYREPAPRAGRMTPLETAKREFLDDWRVYGPPGATPEMRVEGETRVHTWTWTNRPGMSVEPLSPPADRMGEAVIVGLDAAEFSALDAAEWYVEDEFRPAVEAMRPEVAEIAASLAARPSTLEKVQGAVRWARSRWDVVDWASWALFEPRPPSELEDLALPSDLCGIVAAILSELDIGAVPVGVHRLGRGRRETRVFNPNLFNYVLLYVPELDPQSDWGGGLIDVADVGTPVGLLGPEVAGSSGVLLDRLVAAQLPSDRGGDPAVSVTVDAAADADGTLAGEIGVMVTGLATGAFRHADTVLPERVDDIVDALDALVGLDERLSLGSLTCAERTDGRVQVTASFDAQGFLSDAGGVWLLETSVVTPAVWAVELPDRPRRTPVDFGYACRYTIDTTISLPESVTRVEAPDERGIGQASLLRYVRRVSAVDGSVTVHEVFNVEAPTFGAGSYPRIREILRAAADANREPLACVVVD